MEDASLKLGFQVTGSRQLFADLWRKIMNQYTRTRLSFESDWTVALPGIAAAVRQRTGFRYLAGLWEELVPMRLL